MDPGQEEPQTSEEVLRIQGWLVALNYLSASQQTGIYDDATRAAVARFQSDNGLTATGACDSATYALLQQKATGGSDAQGQSDAETAETPADTDTAEPTQPSESTETPEAPETPTEEPAQEAPDDGKNMPGGKGGFGGRGGFSGRRGGTGGSGGTDGEMGDMEEDDALGGVTPGEALTSSHASGDRDTTPYGATHVEDGLDGLDILCDGGRDYDCALTGDALTLTGGDRWTFTGADLRTLNRSGVRRLTLSGSADCRLDTAPAFTGPVYDGLRAAGITANTFEYTVTLEGGAADIAVHAGGGSYKLNDDGTLAPVE